MICLNDDGPSDVTVTVILKPPCESRSILVCKRLYCSGCIHQIQDENQDEYNEQYDVLESSKSVIESPVLTVNRASKLKCL